MANSVFAHSPQDIYNHVTGHKGFDYDQIEEPIYLGTNMCCQFGFDHELLTKGVRADVSLEESKVDAPTGVDFFLWLPTKSNGAPSDNALALGVQALEFFVQRKIPVYVHCQYGHGRAPTLVAAYLIRRGMSTEEALAYIKNKRAAIQPNDVQMAALRAWERNMRPAAREQ